MKNLALLLLIVAGFLSCDKRQSSKNTMNTKAPTADKIAKTMEIHGDVRVDNYYWLNDKENPEVIDYLERENDYYNKMTAHTDALKEDLFQEIKGRIKEDDASVPYLYNGY
ncbi:MAG: oligopeptidase B, partial [Planctomycetota bacterium]